MGIEWDIDTLTDAEIYIDHHAAVEAIRTEKRHRGEMVRAALYTYRLCYVTRRVGPAPDQVSSQDFAAELGYSKSYVTLLRRLGRAMVIHGVSPDSELFSALRRAAFKKEVGRLLERNEAVSHELLWSAIDEHAAHMKTRGASSRATPDPDQLLMAVTQAVRHALPAAERGQLESIQRVLEDLLLDVRRTLDGRRLDV